MLRVTIARLLLFILLFLTLSSILRCFTQIHVTRKHGSSESSIPHVNISQSQHQKNTDRSIQFDSINYLSLTNFETTMLKGHLATRTEHVSEVVLFSFIFRHLTIGSYLPIIFSSCKNQFIPRFNLGYHHVEFFFRSLPRCRVMANAIP